MEVKEDPIINTLKESLHKLAKEGTLMDTIKTLKECEKEYRESEVCGESFYNSIRRAQGVMEFLGVDSNMHPNEALAYAIQACRKGMLALESVVQLDPKTHCPKCGHFMGIV